jgi:hypothetical protein
MSTRTERGERLVYKHVNRWGTHPTLAHLNISFWIPWDLVKEWKKGADVPPRTTGRDQFRREIKRRIRKYIEKLLMEKYGMQDPEVW